MHQRAHRPSIPPIFLPSLPRPSIFDLDLLLGGTLLSQSNLTSTSISLTDVPSDPHEAAGKTALRPGAFCDRSNAGLSPPPPPAPTPKLKSPSPAPAPNHATAPTSPTHVSQVFRSSSTLVCPSFLWVVHIVVLTGLRRAACGNKEERI